MQPGRNLPGAEQKVLPFNISLGAPLADYPIAHAALSILELVSGEIPFEQASKLIRSPFLAGAEPELSVRARLDAELRKRAPARLTLGKLVALIEGHRAASASKPFHSGAGTRRRALTARMGRHFTGFRSGGLSGGAAWIPTNSGRASSTRRSPSSPNRRVAPKMSFRRRARAIAAPARRREFIRHA
jgi:hypothetical protein